MSADFIWLLVVTGFLMAGSFLAGLIVGAWREWDRAYKRGLQDSDARWKRLFVEIPHCKTVPLSPGVNIDEPSHRRPESPPPPPMRLVT